MEVVFKEHVIPTAFFSVYQLESFWFFLCQELPYLFSPAPCELVEDHYVRGCGFSTIFLVLECLV